MQKRGSAQALREHNRKAVLACLRDQAPNTRTRLSARTKLSPATISAIVDELISDQLLVEVGKERSRGGRRAVMLDFNEQKYFFLCADLAVDTISVALVNLRFQVLAHRSRPVQDRRDPALLLQQLVETAQEVLATLGAGERVLGMCIGVTGVVNKAKDTIVYSAAFDIRNLNMRAELARFFDFPIYTFNDANLSALAEKYYLSSLGYCLYLMIGPSLGAGVIVNGDIYSGQSGWAGEIGHSIVERAGPVCFCGKRGCLVSVLAQYIPVGSAEKLRSTFAWPSGRDFYASSAYEHFCYYVGLIISNYVKIFDPETVIIGGVVAEVAPQKLYADLEACVNEQFLLGDQPVSILPAQVKANSVIIGGAYFCFDNILL